MQISAKQQQTKDHHSNQLFKKKIDLTGSNSQFIRIVVLLILVTVFFVLSILILYILITHRNNHLKEVFSLFNSIQSTVFNTKIAYISGLSLLTGEQLLLENTEIVTTLFSQYSNLIQKSSEQLLQVQPRLNQLGYALQYEELKDGNLCAQNKIGRLNNVFIRNQCQTLLDGAALMGYQKLLERIRFIIENHIDLKNYQPLSQLNLNQIQDKLRSSLFIELEFGIELLNLVKDEMQDFGDLLMEDTSQKGRVRMNYGYYLMIVTLLLVFLPFQVYLFKTIQIYEKNWKNLISRIPYWSVSSNKLLMTFLDRRSPFHGQ